MKAEVSSTVDFENWKNQAISECKKHGWSSLDISGINWDDWRDDYFKQGHSPTSAVYAEDSYFE